MKTYEKIRTISTTHSGDRFAVAEFEKRIQNAAGIPAGLVCSFFALEKASKRKEQIPTIAEGCR